MATNVVFNAAGTARCIDWGWAHVGDVAQDLAHIGGQVHGGPWYVPVSAAQIEVMTRHHLQARRTVQVCRSGPEHQRYGVRVRTLRSTLASTLTDEADVFR